MNKVNLWKNRHTRAWMITSVALVAFFTAASLVLTKNDLVSGTMDIVFGGKRAIVAGNNNYYVADYSTKADSLKAANDFTEKVCEEGTTLLKNEDGALPLASGAKVTVFGKNSVNLVYGGSGSSSGKVTASRRNLFDSLTDAKISYNPTMKAFYEGSSSGSGRPSNPGMGDIIAGFETGETPVSSYTSEVKASYASYKDAAIVVISRIGGEGFDLPRTMKTSYGADATKVNGARNADDHYLQLDQNETDMLAEACSNFDKVIVVLNTSQPIELGFLDDPTHYAYHSQIKACLWMGLPGDNGVMALGKILNGTVNPSGHLADTYARNFKDAPSYRNFGNNNADEGNGYTVDGESSGYYYVDYEEGISVGYRYYETRNAVELESNPSSTWYKDNVVYPFGYGLSYTSFTWEVESSDPSESTALTQDGKITVKVKVTNTGDVAGKEVVELYYHTPYTKGGIEKSETVLGDFAKTKLLEPKASETVTLSLPVSDMKSYDYSDANQNGFKGYELEKGNYEIRIGKNAHETFKALNYTVASDVKISTDETTGTAVTNQFDDVSSHIASYLTRNDYAGTFPTTPSATDRAVTSDFISSLTYKKDDTDKPWTTDTMPTQAESEIAKEDITVSLKDVVGKKYDDASWDTLLNELTVTQMTKLIGTGAYGTISIDNISKPLTYEPDGPSGFTNFMTDGGPVYNTCFYAAECVLGASWNKELAYDMGISVGNEALVGDCDKSKLPYSGWYAPAVNIHRSPFSGRNWEYYSEDGYLSGALASQVVLGCKKKGVYTFVKHFVANDQETNRDTNGCIVWLNEQALREIYLKPFEMVVKTGQTTAMMSSFNRLGTTWAGGSYPLLTTILRNEWGFEGEVVTDYNLVRYMNVDQMIRAGGDLVLNQGNKAPSTTNLTATQVSCIRRATHNILYTIANSNAMNSEVTGYRMALWRVILILVDSLVALALVVWGFLVIFFAVKKANSVPADQQPKK
jgi:beta-glucosidase